MRKLSRAELESQLSRTQHDLTLSRDALQAFANGEVQHLGRRTMDGTRYGFGIAGLTRPNGGLFLITTSVKQLDGKWDRPYTSVYYLDDVYARASQHHCSCSYEAMEKEFILMAARTRDEVANAGGLE